MLRGHFGSNSLEALRPDNAVAFPRRPAARLADLVCLACVVGAFEICALSVRISQSSGHMSALLCPELS